MTAGRKTGDLAAITAAVILLSAAPAMIHMAKEMKNGNREF